MSLWKCIFFYLVGGVFYIGWLVFNFYSCINKKFVRVVVRGIINDEYILLVGEIKFIFLIILWIFVGYKEECVLI